eukprot:COSAG02_NODE_1110_length_14511_cov_30.804122_3_plen_52_part_00
MASQALDATLATVSQYSGNVGELLAAKLDAERFRGFVFLADFGRSDSHLEK